MDALIEKQRREQEVKSKFKRIAMRQNELKLMKAARKMHVHGDALTKESTRKLLRQVMRVFLQFGFPENAVGTIVSFLPLYAWEDDLDAFAETIYLTVEFPEDHRNIFTPIRCKQLQRTEMFGPSSMGKWHSVDGTLTLTRNEISINGVDFASEEGFTPNRKSDFLSKYTRLRPNGYHQYGKELIKVFTSPCNILPDEIQQIAVH